MSDEVKERPRVRLEWLAIERFREVAPGTRLEFAPGVNLLLGMNGSGKTTLLDLIAACVRGNFSAYADETFALRYGLRAGAMGYEFQVSNEEVVIDPALREVMREMPGGGAKRRATTRVIEREGERERARVEVTAGRAVRWDGEHPEAVEIPRIFDANPLGFSLLDAVLFMSFRAEGVKWHMAPSQGRPDGLYAPGAVVRFDEALWFFLMITTQSTTDAAAFAIVPMVSGSGLLPRMPVPLGFSDAAIPLHEKSPEGTFRITEQELPLLGTIAELTGFRRIEMAFSAPEVRDSGRAAVLLYRPPDFLCTREDGQVVRHNHLSFGQKRLLAFFYYVACNPDVVVADELVNGLHHGWIARCLQEIGDRQAFLTSQNPLLVDMVPFQGADELRRSFVVCRADHDPNDPKRRLILRWRPLDVREAEELAALLSVDVQPASEILLAMGLW